MVGIADCTSMAVGRSLQRHIRQPTVTSYAFLPFDARLLQCNILHDYLGITTVLT